MASQDEAHRAFKPPTKAVFVEQQVEQCSWLVEGWVKKGGLTLLSGQPKLTWKTFLAERVGDLLAAGVSEGPIHVMEQGNVLFVEEESPQQDTIDRAKAHAATYTPDVAERAWANTYMSHRWGLNLLDGGHVKEVREFALKTDCKLVVLDPWSRVLKGGEENDGAVVSRGLAAASALQQVGLAVLLVLHLNKLGMKDRASDIDVALRGHSGLSGAYDSHVAVRRYSSRDEWASVEIRNKLAETVDLAVKWELATEVREARGGEKVLCHAKPLWGARELAEPIEEEEPRGKWDRE